MSALCAPTVPPSLPCLFSNNSTEASPKDLPKKTPRLTGPHSKTPFVVGEEIKKLVKQYGLNRLGFFTLTAADGVTSIKEANRRFNSLNTHVLKTRFERAVFVLERHKSGAIHYHGVVVMPADIRTGFDFEAVKSRDYRSASQLLRDEWKFWRKTAKKFKFGRTELLPIKTNADGISYYVGGYIRKHLENRLPEDKGARLIRFIGYKPGDRAVSRKFSWNSDGGWLWRQKAKIFSQNDDLPLPNAGALLQKYGPRWAFILQDKIFETRMPPDANWPSQECYQRECVRLVDGIRWAQSLNALRESWEGKTSEQMVLEQQAPFVNGGTTLDMAGLILDKCKQYESNPS